MKNIIIGLFALMLSNIVLDVTIKTFTEQFDFKSFFKIILKSMIILIASLLIYYAGYLNPTILVVTLNNVEMNLVDSLKMIYIAGIMFYGFNCIKKLSKLISDNEIDINSVPFQVIEEDDTYPIIEIPDEDENKEELEDPSEEVKG